LGEHGAATFDFQGYVRESRENYEKGISYRDVLTTNGILKGNEHTGIHIGTDGIINYNAYEGNRKMKGPEDIGEYDIYIRIPTALQKEKGVFIQYGRCSPANEVSAEELKEIYSRQIDSCKRYGIEPGEHIVIRLDLEPKNDPSARKKAQAIHIAILRHIESGQPLDKIENLVRNLEASLSE